MLGSSDSCAAAAANAHQRLRRAPLYHRHRTVRRDRCLALSEAEFVSHYRIDLPGFREILAAITPHLPRRQRNIMRQVSLKLKLRMCLRYLAGGSCLDIADLHGVHEKTAYEHIKLQHSF